MSRKDFDNDQSLEPIKEALSHTQINGHSSINGSNHLVTQSTFKNTQMSKFGDKTRNLMSITSKGEKMEFLPYQLERDGLGRIIAEETSVDQSKTKESSS